MDDMYRGGTAPTMEDPNQPVIDSRQIQSAGLNIITEQHNGHSIIPSKGVQVPPTIEESMTGAGSEEESPPFIHTAPATLGVPITPGEDAMGNIAPTTGESAETELQDSYGTQELYARMSRRPLSQPTPDQLGETPEAAYSGNTGAHRQLLDMDGLRDVIRMVVREEVPNGLKALQSDVLDLHGDLQHLQGFVAGTGQRETSVKGLIAQVERLQQEQWNVFQERISDLRNAILEHPNVDSSALGVFDRDALEDAVESSRMATIVGQEAKAEGSRMAKLVVDMQEQMEAMETKMAQAKGPDAETQALTARLKRDMEVLLQRTEDVQVENEQLAGKLADMQQSNLFLRTEVEELKQRLEAGDEFSKNIQEILETSYDKLDSSVQEIRETLTEKTEEVQSSTTTLQQEVTRIAKDVSEAHRLASVVGPHTMDVLRGELEGLSAKVDQVQVSVPSAVAPVQERIKQIQDNLLQLESAKLDASDAVTRPMLEKSVARAVDSADRKVNLVMSAISSLEERMEFLTNSKADLDVVAMKAELEQAAAKMRLATEDIAQKLRSEVQEGLALKLDTPLLNASEKKTGQRITQLEGAILRGLKAVSDRVAAALLEKADSADLNDFRMQMRGILSEVDLRLRELSPASRIVAAGPNGRSAHCMTCDQQVSTIKDSIMAGSHGMYGVTGALSVDERVFPTKLPAMKQWHNSYEQVQEAEPRGASTNANMVQTRLQKEAALRPTPLNTDDWAPSSGSLPPVAETSPKRKGDSVSGSLARNSLPARSPVRGPAPASPGGSRSGVGQPGLEIAGFAH